MPSSDILTISPVTILMFLDIGNVKVIAISSPAKKGLWVLIKTPLELKFVIDALK